jgi:hypothetical protein
MNPCGHSPYSTSSLIRGWVYLLWIGLAFVKCTNRTYSIGLRGYGECVFSSREAVRPIKVIVFYEELLIGFEICLSEQSHIYMQVLRLTELFTEPTAPPPNVIFIKCYDFELPINSISYIISLSTIFVMIIILTFPDTALLSSMMICCTTVANDCLESPDLYYPT